MSQKKRAAKKAGSQEATCSEETSRESRRRQARRGNTCISSATGRRTATATMKDLLGGKGSGLAEMTNAGLPVPPGFTISTEVCNIYYKEKAKIPAAIDREIDEHVKKLEKAAGATLGSTENPLLVSVRSGAKFSMPGMMDTILNLGLNDDAVEGLKRRTQQRPLRVRQLPPLHPDVRQRRARDSEGRVRARVRGGEEGAAARSSTPISTRRRCATWSSATRSVVKSEVGPRRFRRIRASSSRWRATPCSVRG